jgi:hypothetical protein
MIKIVNVLMIVMMIEWINCQAYENYFYPVEEEQDENIVNEEDISRVLTTMKKIKKHDDSEMEYYNLINW